ncbi:MAG: peptidoglycan editing factor PgeF [Gammaproteobacteria bacterium]|nr:peptidoglycan editing factor PgeF [Gammaproteobacteria bacterium]
MPDRLLPESFPAGVRAAATTCGGGVSTGRYAGLNLGDHVGDDRDHVSENRRRLRRALGLPAEPRWLSQVHGADVARQGPTAELPQSRADAAVTCEAGVVLAVLTADCLPVLLAAADGSEIGVAHAGWRGLAAGVIEAALAAMSAPPAGLVAWLGPAIGAAHYEVDAAVHDAFRDSPGAEAAFAPCRRNGHWHCDLVALARARLAAAGVPRVSGGAWDTFAEPDRFFSFRRDGQTGRMASLVWIDDE